MTTDGDNSELFQAIIEARMTAIEAASSEAR